MEFCRRRVNNKPLRKVRSEVKIEVEKDETPMHNVLRKIKSLPMPNLNAAKPKSIHSQAATFTRLNKTQNDSYKVPTDKSKIMTFFEASYSFKIKFPDLRR